RQNLTNAHHGRPVFSNLQQTLAVWPSGRLAIWPSGRLPLSRQFAQLVVDQRQELLRCSRVALLDGRQDTGYFGHGIKPTPPLETGRPSRMAIHVHMGGPVLTAMSAGKNEWAQLSPRRAVQARQKPAVLEGGALTEERRADAVTTLMFADRRRRQRSESAGREARFWIGKRRVQPRWRGGVVSPQTPTGRGLPV